MIKTVAVLAVLCGICAGYSIPLQNAFMYYQQPMGASRQSLYGIHYQNQQLRNPGRSAAVSAFAAGNTIATGTYLKDCQDDESSDSPPQDQNVQPAADAHPEEQVPVEDVQDDIQAVHEEEVEEAVADESAAASPAVPAVVPDKKKKKVTIQVDSDEEEEEDSPVYHRGASRPADPNAFFPISFGGTNGDIIAIANSYSTGKDGSAISSASAYGSPVTAELRKTSPVQLKKKAAKVRSKQH